jgi:hypothetical protein
VVTDCNLEAKNLAFLSGTLHTLSPGPQQNVGGTRIEEALKTLDIAKIGIAALGRLVVYPKLPTGRDLAFIYRAATEVNWDAGWFKQIFRAVRGEYGISLSVSDNTK